jgi:hypothetical protein
MFNLKLLFVLISLTALIACTKEGQQDISIHTADEQAAVQSAKKWLALVDEGNYRESWDEAADVFRNAVTNDEWEEMLGKIRPLFGKVIKRNVKSQAYQSSVPAVPDGEYVVIQFQTKFEHKANAIETVTPSKGKYGKWRVAGNYIK